MRLIDADALKQDLTRFYDNEVTAKRLIDEQPTKEPCNTDTCKVVRAYMNEWDKPNNSDAISRQAVIDGINRYFHDEYYQRTSIQDCRDCFIEDVIKKLPPVKPQESTEWQQDHEILKAYSDGANEMLDKIRSEVEDINPWAIRYAPLEDGDTRPKIVTNVKSHVLEIIDKYKAGSEL
jgi:hypothetical protein